MCAPPHSRFVWLFRSPAATPATAQLILNPISVPVQPASVPPSSVATAWLESRKPNKPSRIEAEPSCCNGFGLQRLGSGLKWLQVAFSGCRGFVPDLAKVCLPPVGGDDRLEYIDFCMVLAHVTRRTNMWQNATAKPFTFVQYAEISLYNIWLKRLSYKEISAYWTYVKLFCGRIAGLAYSFLFPLCFIDLHNYGDSGSMVFHSNFMLTGSSFHFWLQATASATAKPS